jgi:hypothetical protein
MGRWQTPQAADGGVLALQPLHHDAYGVAVPLPMKLRLTGRIFRLTGRI